MLKIKNKNIIVNRGNEFKIKLKIPTSNGFYLFPADSNIIFTIKKNFKDSNPVLRKIYTVDETTDIITMDFTSEDTSFGGLIDIPTTYYYDISLNGDTTLIGYDDKGYKTFTLYPEGSRDE